MAKAPKKMSIHDKWRADSDGGAVRIVKPAPKKAKKSK